jgi:hypothetical protein
MAPVLLTISPAGSQDEQLCRRLVPILQVSSPSQAASTQVQLSSASGGKLRSSGPTASGSCNFLRIRRKVARPLLITARDPYPAGSD